MHHHFHPSNKYNYVCVLGHPCTIMSTRQKSCNYVCVLVGHPRTIMFTLQTSYNYIRVLVGQLARPHVRQVMPLQLVQLEREA